MFSPPLTGWAFFWLVKWPPAGMPDSLWSTVSSSWLKLACMRPFEARNKSKVVSALLSAARVSNDSLVCSAMEPVFPVNGPLGSGL